eukprot:1158612-Pelagomonas_calceolata.AAC.1
MIVCRKVAAKRRCIGFWNSISCGQWPNTKALFYASRCCQCHCWHCHHYHHHHHQQQHDHQYHHHHHASRLKEAAVEQKDGIAGPIKDKPCLLTGYHSLAFPWDKMEPEWHACQNHMHAMLMR